MITILVALLISIIVFLNTWVIYGSSKSCEKLFLIPKIYKNYSYSVSLGTDHPLNRQKVLIMLHMFKNNTYTDSRTAYKHALIPSDIVQVI